MTKKANDKYACQMISEASEFYIKKMLQLGTMEELKNCIPSMRVNNHLMFCIDRIESMDGKRIYEFLIEYHTKKPSEGIYYGCRGITKQGVSHKCQIRQFQKDWEMVRPVLTQQLNNNLPEYNAEGRYRMTDNANDNTYWLFWISLREDEDICSIGLRATTTIRNVFREYLLHPDDFVEKIQLANASLNRKAQRQKTQLNPVIPFTIEAYDSFIVTQPKEVIDFLDKAKQKGWIIENNDFGQYALQFRGCAGHDSNLDFAVMMYIFYNEILMKKTIPWVQIQQIFIDCYGSRFGNIKSQIAQAQNDTLIFWKDAIKNIAILH